MFSYAYQFLDSFAFLILAVAGLSIIFGMMGIINLAHGEFIMLGAYAMTIMANASIPFPIAVLGGAAFVGAFGFLCDKLIIRHLYDRPLDSVVATWGISLLLKQGVLILMGASLPGLTTPLGNFMVGGTSYSIYRMILALISILLLIFLYWLFMKTKFGLLSRATMQNNSIAQAMGVNTSNMYSLTFTIGSALAGLCGALYGPTMTITPTMGQAFQNDSFVTVIVGGANPLVGTALSGTALGAIQSVLNITTGTFFGKMGLLVVAIIVIRILPKGFSGLVERRMEKRKNR